jgi:hypothetical protein
LRGERTAALEHLAAALDIYQGVGTRAVEAHIRTGIGHLTASRGTTLTRLKAAVHAR